MCLPLYWNVCAFLGKITDLGDIFELFRHSEDSVTEKNVILMRLDDTG